MDRRHFDSIDGAHEAAFEANRPIDRLSSSEAVWTAMQQQLLDKYVQADWQNHSAASSLASRASSRRERARRAFENRLYRSMIGMPPDSAWKLLLALFTEHGYLQRFIRRRLGQAAPIDTVDRRVLEHIIFPRYLADSSVKRVLFVGCENYTAHYQQRFFASHDYWTIEPDPKMRRYGAKQHVVATLQQLTDHFRPGYFNLILCNGVYGWGLDTLEQCESAFAECHACLAPGGHLLIGWDDIPTHRAPPLQQIASLGWFNRVEFPTLGSCRYVTDTPYRHSYEFYQRPH